MLLHCLFETLLNIFVVLREIRGRCCYHTTFAHYERQPLFFYNLSLLYDAFEASSRGLLCVASEFGKALVLLPDVQKFWTLCSIDCIKLPICSSQWDVSRAGISFLWNLLLLSDSADCDYKFKPVYGTTQGLCQTCRRQVGMLPSSPQRHEFCCDP